MGIVRKNPSGKAVHFITDEGVVYTCSYTMLLGTLAKDNKGGNNFLVLSKLPFPVSNNRFPKSPVYNPETNTLIDAKVSIVDVKPGEDAYSDKSRNEFKEVKRDLNTYTDKNIEW
ncbi:MAG TPA: hypothetical protein V6C58_19610 [Allocoleopsis sp.]